MPEGTVWQLTLSPPDPDAGIWFGTIGPGGTIIWPSPIDPNPPGGGGLLDDPFPAPLIPAIHVVNAPGILDQLATGDAVPIGVTGVAATGTLGPIQAPSFPTSITIGVNTLNPVAGNRTSGLDNYQGTLGSFGNPAPQVAEIVAAINDPLNSFFGQVFATDLSPYILITAQTPGTAGNSIVLTSSDLNQLFGPWPVATQGLDFVDGGGASDLIVLTDGTLWPGLGFPTGPRTIIVANAEVPATYDGTYAGSNPGALPAALAVGLVWPAPGYVDDNTATVTAQGIVPAPGTLSGGVDPL
jgi:hypothetical protein